MKRFVAYTLTLIAGCTPYAREQWRASSDTRPVPRSPGACDQPTDRVMTMPEWGACYHPNIARQRKIPLFLHHQLDASYNEYARREQHRIDSDRAAAIAQASLRRSFAACAAIDGDEKARDACTRLCSTPEAVVSAAASPCSLTSDTGPCAWDKAGGVCCVCKP